MKKKWYTCTPVSFRGDETFFQRDSGLLCRGLQALGYESRAIMPNPVREGDLPELIRTEYRNLFSADWWASLGLHGVLMYSWADPKYNGIVRAVRKAGIRLFVNIDNEGIISPFGTFWAYCRLQYDLRRFAGGPYAAWIGTALKVAARVPAVGVIDYPRMRHLAQADAVGVVSPIAAERVRQYCRHLGCGAVAKKIHCIPHPIASVAGYGGEAKEAAVVAAGRWDAAFHKNPTLLVQVMAECLRRKMKVRFYIAGRGLEEHLRAAGLAAGQTDAVTYLGGVGHEVLTDMMRKSRVVLCTSRYESFHMVSAEGLCCGCSVVGPRRTGTPAFEYFVSHNSGTLAATYDAPGYADALERELSLWEAGQRNAHKISAFALEQFQVTAVLQKILALSGNTAPGELI